MAVSNPQQALKLNRELFLELARQDEIYLVPESEVSEEALTKKLFRPYIAPAQGNDPRPFLRIFSHRDVAKSFAERLGQHQVCQIDGVEMIQLAKTYFLRGTYGFLLNDGLAWAALSFPDFLVDCFRNILGDPNLARPEFVVLVQFINMVRQNKFYNIQAGRQSEVDVKRHTRAVFTDQPNNVWFDNPGEWIYDECTLDHLAQASELTQDSIISIKTAKIDLHTSPDMLRAALFATGVAEPDSIRFDLDFHTDSIALDYQMKDFDIARLPLRVQIAELPKIENLEEENEEPPESAQQRKSHKSKFSLLFAMLRKRGQPPAAEQTTAEEEVLDLPSDEVPPTAGQEKKPESRRLRIPSSKTMVRLFFLAAFLIIAAAVAVRFFAPVPKDELEKAIQEGNYSEVVSLYEKSAVQNSKNKEEMLQLMAVDLQNSLDAYAADEITANQLVEIIAAYEGIPAMAAKCGEVYSQASALEQSKLAYQQGLLETAMTKRLSVWRGVIKEDTGSQKAMRGSLDENAELYRTSVFNEVAGMETGEALASLNMLQSYYPNDNAIANQIKDWLDSVSKPSPQPQPGASGITPVNGSDDWPIGIEKITVTPGDGENSASGQWDLHIRWGNNSGRPIQSVLFSVTPLNADGEEVYNADGSYSEYMAIAQGPYENGYVMPDTVYWIGAWVNKEIAEIPAVRLNSIQVWYDDGDDGWSTHDAKLFGELPERQDGEQSMEKQNPVDSIAGLLN